MKRFGIGLLAVGFATFLAQPALRAQTNEAPPFKEVYDLIRAHIPGMTDAELNRAAVEGLLKELGPKARLVTTDARTSQVEKDPISQVGIFEGNIAYLRIAHVEDGLAKQVGDSYKELSATNKVNGIVLDLRYADGDDYGAAAAAADLFISKAQPLLNLGNGVVSSHDNPDAIKIPVAVLINGETSGAAEALGAALREANVGLILGSRTAGEALMARDFTLQNGEQLRIAAAPVMLGDGSVLPAQGIQPDIDVKVNAADERAYFADAFRVIPKSNLASGAGLLRTNQPGDTNGMLHRINEADLVRARRQGVSLDEAVPQPQPAGAQVLVVADPALARALDLLRGLAVVRQTRF